MSDALKGVWCGLERGVCPVSTFPLELIPGGSQLPGCLLSPKKYSWDHIAKRGSARTRNQAVLDWASRVGTVTLYDLHRIFGRLPNLLVWYWGLFGNDVSAHESHASPQSLRIEGLGVCFNESQEDDPLAREPRFLLRPAATDSSGHPFLVLFLGVCQCGRCQLS